MSDSVLPKTIVIAAGGTGGHFFPAEALATELAQRGYTIVLMTDQRAGQRTTGIFSQGAQYILSGSGVAGYGLQRKVKAGLSLVKGALQARSLLQTIRPAAVVGFGGYPSVPPLLGAHFLKRSLRPKIILHEGNAVLGQANRLLARFADGIATSFPHVSHVPLSTATTLTGMPVRPDIEKLYQQPYTPPTDKMNLLVWGGSLGARIFSEVVPAALTQLPASLREKLHITQQVRTEDTAQVQSTYAMAGIACTIAPFFTNVESLLQKAHLVIGRAGGSSIAELTMSGRPSLLVPLPIAASDEQTANARFLTEVNAAWLIPQKDFTASSLTSTLEKLLSTPSLLEAAAQAAHQLAHPLAARHLADFIEHSITPRQTEI